MMTSTATDRMTMSAPAGEEMACPRCGGFMVSDRFIDLLDDTGHLEFTAARCVSCGEVVDPVIIENRLRGVQPGRAAKRGRANGHAAGQNGDGPADAPQVERVEVNGAVDVSEPLLK